MLTLITATLNASLYEDPSRSRPVALCGIGAHQWIDRPGGAAFQPLVQCGMGIRVIDPGGLRIGIEARLQLMPFARETPRWVVPIQVSVRGH